MQWLDRDPKARSPVAQGGSAAAAVLTEPREPRHLCVQAVRLERLHFVACRP